MGIQLTYKPLDNLGINGLNTQHNPTTLDSSWLTKADNIVLKESGRITFRKGFNQKILENSDGVDSSALSIGSITEHHDNSDKIFAGVGEDIYEVNFSNPDAPWTHPDNGGTLLGAGDDSDWQFINFNHKIYALQKNNTPLEYDGGTWTKPTDPTQTLWTMPGSNISYADFKPSCGMGFYGRMWVGGVPTAPDVVYYSDTLLGTKFSQGGTTQSSANQTLCEEGGFFWNSINDTCYTLSTSAGFIDLKTVWGQDEIVAIAPFYGKLVIFGRHNIVLYKNADDPNNMALEEVIKGIGCVSRDTVQSVGDDLMFLSDTGLRSLARTTEKDNIPMQDFSHAIKDTITRNIGNNVNAKAIYVESEGVYMLTFVDIKITYIFDMKHFTALKTPRVTLWSFSEGRTPASLAYTDSYGLLIGQLKGSIAAYEGYFDRDYRGSETFGAGETNTKIVAGTTYVVTDVVLTDWSAVGGESTAAINDRFVAVWTGDAAEQDIASLGNVQIDRPSFSYTGRFTTTWIEVTNGVVASLLKKVKAIISGGSGSSVGLKWYKDFSSVPAGNMAFTLNPTQGGVPGYWGTAEYGSSEYAPTYGHKEYNMPLAGSAKHLQIEMSASAQGYSALLQDITLLYKEGKIR